MTSFYLNFPIYSYNLCKFASSFSSKLSVSFNSDCKTFMEMFREVAESQKKKEENKDATAAAGLLEKLSVEEKKTEDKAKDEVPAATKEEKESKSEEAEKKSEAPAPST